MSNMRRTQIQFRRWHRSISRKLTIKFLLSTVVTRLSLHLTLGISLGISLAISLGCEKSVGGSRISIPRVDLECSTSACQSASNTKPWILTITSSGCDPDNIEFGLIAVSSGSGLCTAGTCSATATSWIDSEHQPVTTMPTGSYSVCGIFDLNNSYAGFADTGDAELILNGYVINGGSTVLTLDDWSDVP